MTPTVATRSDSRRAMDSAETIFAIPGMHCAGCIGKIERGLTQTSGVQQARVNFTAKRVTVRHDPALTIPHITQALAQIGFEAQPLGESALTVGTESRDLLKALAVAGFAAMNIMLLSVSVWSGADGGTRDLFHWLSAVIALPAIAYAGRPFFDPPGQRCPMGGPIWTCRFRLALSSQRRSACLKPSSMARMLILTARSCCCSFFWADARSTA